MRNKKWLCLLLCFVFSFQIGALSACSGDSGAGTSGSSGGQGGGEIIEPTETDDETPKYRVNYYTGSGASQVPSETGLKEGDTITRPADPQYVRHTFEGWFTDYGTYEKPFEFGAMPAKNITVYAKWTAAASNDDVAEYEAQLNESSQDGHLYIHYLRFDNDPAAYEDWDLWVWPEYETGKVFDWKRDGKGNVIVDDIAGATCEIDLTVKYTDAGKDGRTEMQFLVDEALGTTGALSDPENYTDERIGFLVVFKSSRGIVGQHWQSDGNANQYIEIENAVWDNGSIHIFCVQDNIADYVTHLSEQGEIVNPYENDDGSHVSTSNLNSSENLKVNYGTQLLDTVSGVGYQIMVSSFADSNGDGLGDIRGIINNLDYIKSLNVDVLWLTPIQLSDSYHGYDIIDYKAVDPKFGTLADYKELLTLCHESGMKVIMDLVLNHTSTNNVWFQKSVKMIEEDGIDYRNFYQWRNHTQESLSESWHKYSQYNYSYYGKFSPSMPELNYDNQDTRNAIVDVAKYWLGILGDGTGVDGFRIDAVKHIYMADEARQQAGDIVINDYDDEAGVDYSSNLTKNLNFFTYFTNEIKADYPACYLVGENFDGHAYNVAPYYTAYDGMLDFYMYYNFGQVATYPTSAASLAGANGSNGGSVPTGVNTDKLSGGTWNYAGILSVQQNYSKNGISQGKGSGNADVMGSLFTSNHDIPRLMNNVIRTYNGAKWSVNDIDSSNSAKAINYTKSIISAMMTMPGISWIYYGDELGMTSNYYAGEDASSPHADRAYRQPFKWEKNAVEQTTDFTISGDTTLYVNWDAYNAALSGVKEQKLDENSILRTAMFWTELKSTDEVIRYGDYYYDDRYISWGGDASSLFCFTRSYKGVKYLCVTNFADHEFKAMKSKLPASATLVKITGGGTDFDTLPAFGTMVVKIAG